MLFDTAKEFKDDADVSLYFYFTSLIYYVFSSSVTADMAMFTFSIMCRGILS